MAQPLDYTAYRFSDAIIPKTFTICGVELKPLCLGHLMLLEKTENPMVSKVEVEMNMSDSMYWFFSAILICGLSYEDNIKYHNDDKLYKELMDEFSANLLQNIENDKNWTIFEKLQAFKQYMNYHFDMPFYTEERVNDDKIPSGSDWKQNLYLIFKKLGYSDTEIYNMNIRRLFYEWCSYAESEGGIKVMNRYDLQSLGKL